MDGGGGKLEKGAEELGAADEDPGPGGRQPEGIWDVLQGGSAGSVDFRVRDVGPDPCMERDLGSFRHRVAWRIKGRHSIRQEEGGWYFPPLTIAMEEAGFEEIGVYIINR